MLLSGTDEFSRLLNLKSAYEPLTHYLFRYPAKFHPPIARALIEAFSKPGQTIFDPFCGSGTAAVEALVAGRHAIGMDIDPVAVAVAKAKTRRISPTALRRSAADVLRQLDRCERSANEYKRRQFVDLSAAAFRRQAQDAFAYIPAIPNIEHWFRRYVVIDLARILKIIAESDIPGTHKAFLKIVFASIIRNASNADPVPVSGLEVTSHMLRKHEGGRTINPFGLLRKAMVKALDGSEDFYKATRAGSKAYIVAGDATKMRSFGDVDCIVTSPPYHTAVDYYRRHTLEMYWLGATTSRGARLALRDKYIGRVSVPRRNMLLASDAALPALALLWEKRMRVVSDVRADSFRHYTTAMQRAFEGMARVLRANAPAIIVVGNSRWNGAEVPTDALLTELAGDHFELEDSVSYPLKNRYMSYSRHNGADIKTEQVLVFRRRPWRR